MAVVLSIRELPVTRLTESREKLAICVVQTDFRAA